MFSRIVTRPGTFQQLINQHRIVVCAIRAASDVPATKSESAPVRESAVTKLVRGWDESNALFYGPERDLKNFPVIKQVELPPAAKLGFIPQAWFDALYDKTGVTGPYLLGVGFVATILSKELWVIEHGFSEFITFWIVAFIIIKKLGPGMGTYFSNLNDELNKKRWFEPLANTRTIYEGNIKELETQIEQFKAADAIFDSKRENIAFQLEEEYRKRMTEVHQKVKRRLDYQVEMESARIRYEHRHLVEWVVSNVLKGITPQQEKDALNKCIIDLKQLST